MVGTVHFSVAQRRARLAHRHRLLPGRATDDLAALAEDVVALHSSDPATVYLSAWARMVHPSLAAVEAALYDQRIVIRHHAMRRTLWVTTPPIMRWMHATTTARYAAAQHTRVIGMLAGNGIDDAPGWLEAAKNEVVAALRSGGPMTARVLGQRVPSLAHPIRLAAGTPYEGMQSAHSRVLLQLGFEAALIRTRPVGSWISGQYTWAAMDSWLPEGLVLEGLLDDDRGAAVEREAAAQLARHWLHRFGPATTVDLQWWAGWTGAMTKRALADIGAVAVEMDGGPGWLAPDDSALDDSAPDDSALDGRPEPWLAVLPGLDPTTMGWKQREWYLPATAAAAFDSNGNAGPTIWLDGEVVAGWAQTKDGELRVHWFSEIPAVRRKQVQRRLNELRDWLGPSRFTVRFPAPHQKQLLA